MLHIDDRRIRLIWPSNEGVDSAVIERISEIIRGEALLPGMPRNQLDNKTITITLATEPRKGLDAWTIPGKNLISVSLYGVIRWDRTQLRAVLRHELAHIQMQAFLQNIPVPPWFQEGIAKWWAAGLSCEGKTRIRLDLIQRRRSGDKMPLLFDSTGFKTSKLTYDYLTSFFDYLNRRGGGIISDGRLLAAVKKLGTSKSFSIIFKASPAEIREDWWTQVNHDYNGFPDRPIC